MERGFFQEKLKKLVKQRNALLVPLVAMSLSVIFLSSALKNKEERIVIVPTGGTSFWVEKNRCCSEYLKNFGLYLSGFLFSKEKASASLKNKELLSHVHPYQKHLFKKILEEEMIRIEKEGISFSFEIEKYFSNEKPLSFTCEGIQKTYLPKGDGSSSTEEKTRYTLSFQMEGGKIFLTHVQKELL